MLSANAGPAMPIPVTVSVATALAASPLLMPLLFIRDSFRMVIAPHPIPRRVDAAHAERGRART
ncbi:hypothetical protein GCM10028801_00230 [Nocardioides maradonensis]